MSSGLTPNAYRLFIRFPLVLVIGGLIITGIFTRRGVLDWRRIVAQNEVLASRIDASRAQKDDLERQAAALQSDREAQERMVRQYLGYVRSNERIVEFP